MTQKDWLEVAIRTIGVYVLFCGISNFTEASLMYTDYSRNPDISFRYYLIYGWVDMIVGLVFLRAPGIFTNFAYPQGTADTGMEGETPEGSEPVE